MDRPTTALAQVDIDDKYTRKHGRVFLTGIQALVRLVLTQRRRDAAAGYDTAGYISGYRGSPLGGLDLQLERAKAHLEPHHVVFQPGVNEDVAATACWGTQQAGLDGEGTHDGVFCLWYGKGPGVDRSGDVLRHANLAGTSKLGGVVALLGDDHTCESSTTAHHSEYAMVDASIPVLNPARRGVVVTDEPDFRLEFHLAPPLLARRDSNTGEPRKGRYGTWMMRVFAVLSRLRGLRGTPLDPFGYTAERRRERRLIERYERVMSRCTGGLDHANHAIAVEIASLPDRIRGFGHVKARSIEEAERREADLLARFAAVGDSPDAA